MNPSTSSACKGVTADGVTTVAMATAAAGGLSEGSNTPVVLPRESKASQESSASTGSTIDHTIVKLSSKGSSTTQHMTLDDTDADIGDLSGSNNNVFYTPPAPLPPLGGIRPKERSHSDSFKGLTSMKKDLTSTPKSLHTSLLSM